MKKMIIDILEQPDGIHISEDKDRVLTERLGERLSIIYSQEWTPKNIPNISLHFRYEVKDRKVCAMTLALRMNHQTSEELEQLCSFASNIYNLEFTTDLKHEEVCFLADNMYDMGCLVKAMDFMNFNLASGLFAVVDEEASVDEALIKWQRKQQAIEEELARYDAMEGEEEEYEVDDDYIDEYKVRYSKDRKRLICAMYDFDCIEYRVPDGVEEICGYAFLGANHYVEVSIPRSVTRIGEMVFGDAGGQILIRNK